MVPCLAVVSGHEAAHIPRHRRLFACHTERNGHFRQGGKWDKLKTSRLDEEVLLLTKPASSG
ncbi:unnamed protein product, partial [Laminaria digitata]